MLSRAAAHRGPTWCGLRRILFGGWLLVDGLVLSFMHGMIHAYYCLSIAPAGGGMFAIGVHEMWQRREKWFVSSWFSCAVRRHRRLELVDPRSQCELAARAALDDPGRDAVMGVIALLGPWTAGTRRRFALGALGVGLVGALAGPAAYAIATIGQPHEGGGPSSGPLTRPGRAISGSARARTTPISMRC